MIFTFLASLDEINVVTIPIFLISSMYSMEGHILTQCVSVL